MEIKQIAKALIEAQKEMGNAVKGVENKFFKSRYADLNSIREAVIPSLNKHGICVLQPIVHEDGRNFVKTILLHESGEMLDSYTEIVYAKQNDAQAQGSGITYARRYGLQSLVCVGADDDDGNAASNPQAKQQPQPTKQTPQKAVQEDYLQDWIDELNKCKTLADVTTLFNKNAEKVTADSKILALFTKRKSEVPQ